MADLRKFDGEHSKRHWAFVEATSNRVEKWPSWKQAASNIVDVAIITSKGAPDRPQKPYLAIAGD